MSEERTVYRCLHDASDSQQCPNLGMEMRKGEPDVYCRFACYVAKSEVAAGKFKCPLEVAK